MDAQLPVSVKALILEKGFDCIHTSDLMDGNSTKDAVLSALSMIEKRVVISKDSDFYKSYFQRTRTTQAFID